MYTKTHTIDVVIPAYNASLFIVKTLRSVATQTVLPTRIIVVDDGSTDDTVKIVNYFYQNNPNLDIVCIQQKNAGPSAARNNGIRATKAEYVAFIDADDEWKPTKLEKQLSLYEGNPKLGLVYCDFGLIDIMSNDIENRGFELNPNIRGTVEKELRKGNFIAGSASAVLIPKKVIDEIGYFDETLLGAEDWDYWLRLSNKYCIDFVNEKLVSIRKHLDNSQKNEARMLLGEIRYATKWINNKKYPLLNWLALLTRIHLARYKKVKVLGLEQSHLSIRFFSPLIFLPIFLLLLKITNKLKLTIFRLRNFFKYIYVS